MNRPLRAFSRLIAHFDQQVAEAGLQSASAELISTFARGIECQGQEHLQTKGPVLLASNHPGIMDAFVLLSQISRQDVKFIVSGVPLTESVPASRPYLIFAPGDTHERMHAIRQSIRHLRASGLLLIYPTGKVDPDPDVLPGADQALELWSGSLEILLRSVPQTQVITAIVSGVLSPRYVHHPLTRLQKGWRRVKLAEFIQGSQMLLHPERFNLKPRVTFSPPHPADAFGEGEQVLPALIALARQTLIVHTNRDRSSQL